MSPIWMLAMTEPERIAAADLPDLVSALGGCRDRVVAWACPPGHPVIRARVRLVLDVLARASRSDYVTPCSLAVEAHLLWASGRAVDATLTAATARRFGYLDPLMRSVVQALDAGQVYGVAPLPPVGERV